MEFKLIESTIEGRKLPEKPRNSFLSQLKQESGIDTCSGLKI